MMPKRLATQIQLGVIPLIHIGGQTRVVLVTRTNKDGWVLPKGQSERGVKKRQQASIEAFEEAGIVGRIGKDSVGNYQCRRGSKLITVETWPLVVDYLLKSWPECQWRTRGLFTVRQAERTFADKTTSELIHNSIEQLAEYPDRFSIQLPQSRRILRNWPVKWKSIR